MWAATPPWATARRPCLAALTVCLPYIGFPRTLNALACINEVLPEKA